MTGRVVVKIKLKRNYAKLAVETVALIGTLRLRLFSSEHITFKGGI